MVKKNKKENTEKTAVETNETAVAEIVETAVKVKKIKTSKGKTKIHGKKYTIAKAKIGPNTSYSLEDAAKLLMDTSTSKFIGSVELNIVLHKDKLGTNQVSLPNTTGATKKIEIANDETIKNLQSGKIDFDVLIATPSMMPKLVPFAKLLGPRGLMPNPKNGTVSDNTEKAKENFGGNTLQLKLQKGAPLLHLVIGKINQEEKALSENMMAVIEAVGRSNIKKAVVSSTMGPSIKLSI